MEGTDSQEDFKKLDKSLRIRRIIDTATRLFHQKGYRSTTLDDVSKELGITKAALYHYVSSKENLLSIIYIQALESIFENLHMILEKDLPPDKRLRLIIQNHIKNISIRYLPMLSVFLTEEGHLPESDSRKIREEKKKYTRVIEKTIEQGILQGLFLKADPKLQAYAILGMCNWIYKWYRPEHTTYSSDQIADGFVSLLEAGYLKKERGKELTNLSIPTGPIKKGKHETRKQISYRLKQQCKTMIELIDELEKAP